MTDDNDDNAKIMIFITIMSVSSIVIPREQAPDSYFCMKDT